MIIEHLSCLYNSWGWYLYFVEARAAEICLFLLTQPKYFVHHQIVNSGDRGVSVLVKWTQDQLLRDPYPRQHINERSEHMIFISIDNQSFFKSVRCRNIIMRHDIWERVPVHWMLCKETSEQRGEDNGSPLRDDWTVWDDLVNELVHHFCLWVNIELRTSNGSFSKLI